MRPGPGAAICQAFIARRLLRAQRARTTMRGRCLSRAGAEAAVGGSETSAFRNPPPRDFQLRSGKELKNLGIYASPGGFRGGGFLGGGKSIHRGGCVEISKYNFAKVDFIFTKDSISLIIRSLRGMHVIRHAYPQDETNATVMNS